MHYYGKKKINNAQNRPQISWQEMMSPAHAARFQILFVIYKPGYYTDNFMTLPDN